MVISRFGWYTDAPWCWGRSGRWPTKSGVRVFLDWDFEVGGRVASLLVNPDGYNQTAFWGLDDRGQGMLF